MGMAFSGLGKQSAPSKEDMMRMIALRAGALPERGQEVPADITPDPSLMRAPGGIFASLNPDPAQAAKGVLDDTMQRNASDPMSQPLPVAASAAPTPVTVGVPGNAPARPGGMMFRGITPPAAPNVASNPSSGPVGDIPALDGAAGRLHPTFFQHGGMGEKILGGLGEVALEWSAAAGNPVSMMTLQQRAADHNAQRQFQTWTAEQNYRRQQELDDRNYEDNQKPRYFQSAPGVDYNRYDPGTNQTTNLYQSPTAAQDYAASFGAPGTPEYLNALQTFQLKQWSAPALQAKEQLDDYRTGNRIDLKGVPTYANLHPHAPAARPQRPPTTSNVVAGILQKGSSGQPLNPQEQQIFNSYVNGRYRGRGNGGGIPLAGGAPSQAPVRVSTPDEARRLPPGTLFQTPDGRTKVR